MLNCLIYGQKWTKLAISQFFVFSSARFTKLFCESGCWKNASWDMAKFVHFLAINFMNNAKFITCLVLGNNNFCIIHEILRFNAKLNFYLILISWFLVLRKIRRPKSKFTPKNFGILPQNFSWGQNQKSRCIVK